MSNSDRRARPDPTAPSQLRALFRRHDFRPSKRLGQSFLIDRNIARKIAGLAQLDAKSPVVEIGAGAGAVTQFLVGEAARVVAVEIDARLVAILREIVGDAAEIVRADILRLDWDQVLGTARGPWRVVANLPYSITGPALLRLLQTAEMFDRLVIMVQKEVADRLLAPPGDHARGLLTVLAEAYCDVSSAGSVAAACFYPKPRVMSKILVLEVRRPPLLPETLCESFMSVVKAAFGTRRKMLINALSHDKRLQLPKEETVAILSQCGIDPKQRAEGLSAEDFLRLTRALARPGGKGTA